MRIILLIFTILMFQTVTFATVNTIADNSTMDILNPSKKTINYDEFIKKALNKSLPLEKRVEACDVIRSLSEGATPLTKSQLYNLKVAARYKRYNLLAVARKQNVENKVSKRQIIEELGRGGDFYVEKVAKEMSALNNYYYESKAAKARATNELYFNLYMLGIFEYVTENKTIGTKTMDEALSYLKSNPVTKRDVPNLMKLFELTKAFCDNNATAENVIRLLTSTLTQANSSTVNANNTIPSTRYNDESKKYLRSYISGLDKKFMANLNLPKNKLPRKASMTYSCTIAKNGKLISCTLNSFSRNQVIEQAVINAIQATQFEPLPIEIKGESAIIKIWFSFEKEFMKEPYKHFHVYLPVIDN